MKTAHPLGLLLLLSLFLSACGSTNSEDLQGRFAPAVKVTMSLAGTSPSGVRTVSVSDDILEIDMSSSAAKMLNAGNTFTLNLVTDTDMDPSSAGTAVTLTDGATTFGTGYITVLSASNATAVITLTSALSLNTTPKTLQVLTNTSAILDEDAGEDDPLTVSLTHMVTTVSGNELLY